MRRHLLLPLVSLAATGIAQDSKRMERAYDVRFLAVPLPHVEAGEWPSAGNFLLERKEPEAAAISFTSGEEEGPDILPPGLGISPADLIEVIRRDIAEDSWQNDLNSIEAKGHTLVVVQTEGVHRTLERLLASLRARRARMVAVEAAFVPPEALGGRSLESGPWLTDAEYDAALERSGNRAIRLGLTASNEQRVSAFSGRDSGALNLYVNQTGAIPLPEALVARLASGSALEVLPVAVPDAGAHRLDLKLSSVRIAGPPEKRETPLGEMELFTLSEEYFESTLVIPEGRSAVACICEEPEGGRSFAVLVRARAGSVTDEEVERPADRERFVARTYDVRFITDPTGEGSGGLHPEVLEKLIRRNIEAEAWHDERTEIEVDAEARLIRITARPETHAAVKRALGRLTAERCRMAMVELRELEAPLPELLALRPGTGAAPPERDARAGNDEGGGRRTTLRVLMAGIAGERMEARAYSSKRFVRNWTLVSSAADGGAAYMPEPELDSCGSGFTVSATLEAARGGRGALDLDLRHARADFSRTATANLPASLGSTEGPEAPAIRGSAVSSKVVRAGTHATRDVALTLEIPRQDVLRSDGTVLLHPGTPAVIDIRSAQSGKGRCLIAEMRIFEGLEEGRRP